MFDDIYTYLITNFYKLNFCTYIVVDEKEYIKRLVNGQIDNVQKKIYESNCFCNRDFIKKIVSTHSMFFQFAPDSIKNDYDFTLSLIKDNPNVYRFIKFKDDDKMIRYALQNPFMLQYASDKIKDTYKYVKMTKNEKKEVICYASPRLKKKYGEYSSSYYIGLNFLCR